MKTDGIHRHVLNTKHKNTTHPPLPASQHSRRRRRRDHRHADSHDVVHRARLRRPRPAQGRRPAHRLRQGTGAPLAAKPRAAPAAAALEAATSAQETGSLPRRPAHPRRPHLRRLLLPALGSCRRHPRRYRRAQARRRLGLVFRAAVASGDLQGRVWGCLGALDDTRHGVVLARQRRVAAEEGGRPALNRRSADGGGPWTDRVWKQTENRPPGSSVPITRAVGLISVWCFFFCAGADWEEGTASSAERVRSNSERESQDQDGRGAERPLLVSRLFLPGAPRGP